MKKISIILVLLPLFITDLFTQDLEIIEIDTTSYPIGKVKFFAFNKNYEQITNLQKKEIKIYENGEQREVLEVTCPPRLEKAKLSTVIVVGKTIEKEYIQAACNAWIDFMEEGSECAISAYSTDSELITWFSQDKDSLREAINKIEYENGIDHNAALVEGDSSGLQIAKYGKNKKVLVFICKNNSDTQHDINKILEVARQNRITVIPVLMYEDPSEYTNIIAQVTEGMLYTGINSTDKIRRTLYEIVQTMRLETPCELVYQSENFCECRMIDLNIRMPEYELSESRWFSSPYNSTKRLEFSVPYLTMESAPFDKRTDTTILVTAVNSDFKVRYSKTSHQDFRVSPASFNLKEGESKEITVHYNRKDSSYLYDKVTFNNDQCNNNLLLLTNFDRYDKPFNDSIVVIQPNGGEKVQITESYKIKWKGVAEKKYYKIEYSINNGSTWQTIASYVTGNSYIWKDIPETLSEDCLIRVTSMIDKRIKMPIIFFHSGYSDSHSLSFTKDGSYFAASNSIVGDNNDLEKHCLMFDLATEEILDTLLYSGLNLKVEYNPDNSLLFISYSKDTIYHHSFLDTRTKELVYDTTDFYFRSPSVFSKDGSMYTYSKSYIPRYSTDTMTRVYVKDVYTHRLIFYKEYPYRSISSLDFSHDSKTLAIGLSYSEESIEMPEAYFWDIQTYEELYRLNSNSTSSFYMLFNPVESEVVVIRNDIKVLDTDTFSEIGRIDEHIAFSFAISNDGNLIYNDGWGDDLYDLRTFSKYYIYERYESAYYNRFSPQDLLIGCGSLSNDPYFRIIPRPNISDLSNDNFSLVLPLPVSDNVIFGNVMLSEYKDTTIVNHIMNHGNFPFKVNKISITGNHAHCFEQLSGFAPFELEGGEGKDVKYRFKPEFLGLHRAILEIETDEKKYSYNLMGFGSYPEYKRLANVIDFGLVGVHNYKDRINIQLLRNNGTAPFVLTSLKLEHNLDNRFELLENYDQISINPEEELFIDMRFSPNDLGEVTNNLIINYKDSNDKIDTVLVRGVGGSVNPTLRIGEHQAYSGDTVNIPLYLDGAEYIGLSTARTLSSDLIYNPSILFPLKEEEVIIDESTAKISLDEIPLHGKENIVKNLEFIAALGNSEKTLLELTNYKVNGDDTLNINAQSGVFNLLGICEAGGKRLINSTNIGGISRISQGMGSNKIDIKIELIETGYTEISIYNLLGEKVSVPYAENVTDPGAREIIINTETINSGNYLLIYKTPSSLKSYNIIVLK